MFCGQLEVVADSIRFGMGCSQDNLFIIFPYFDPWCYCMIFFVTGLMSNPCCLLPIHVTKCLFIYDMFVYLLRCLCVFNNVCLHVYHDVCLYIIQYTLFNNVCLYIIKLLQEQTDLNA